MIREMDIIFCTGAADCIAYIFGLYCLFQSSLVEIKVI